MATQIEITAIYTTENEELEITLTPESEQDIIDAIIEEAENQDIELYESDIDLDNLQVIDWDELNNYESDQDLEVVYKINESYIDLPLEVILAYVENVGIDYIDDVEEAYQGQYDSDKDFAQELAEEIGAVNRNAAWPNNCIDWEQAASELMYGYFESNGHYFRNL